MLKPTTIYLETTNLCNAKCIMCPHPKMQRKKSIMPQHLFEYSINSIAEIDDLTDVRIFLHKEGEPLLDPDIVNRIKYARNSLKNPKELVINTNAMLLTEKLSETLIESGLNTIYFSIDGATAETYNSIRINLDYSTVEKNLQNFFRLRAQHKNKLRIVMQMLVSDENVPEAKLFREKWSDFNCEFYIKRMHSYLDGIASSFQKNKSNQQLHVCDDPFRMMVIYVDGSIGVCCWDYENSYKAGYITEGSILEIFNNKQFVKLRKKQLKKNCYDINPCNRCMRIYGDDKITGLKIQQQSNTINRKRN